MRRWTEWEEGWIRYFWPDHSAAFVARRMKRTIKSVQGKAARLRLKKSRKRLETMASENLKRPL